MRKLHELSEPLKAILQDELEKRIPKTDFRQATLFRIADLLLVMQIKLLEANKTKLDSKTYKDNLNALETLNCFFKYILSFTINNIPVLHTAFKASNTISVFKY